MLLCVDDADRMILAERVKAARLAQGLTVEAAARQAIISRTTWERVEAGLRVQDVKLAVILRTLHLDKPVATTEPTGPRWIAPPEADRLSPRDIIFIEDLIRRLAAEDTSDKPE